MTRAWRPLGALLMALAVLPGCGSSDLPAVKTYEVKIPTGLEQAKRLLEQYAQGQPLGSEVTNYPQILEEVKKTDPQKAAVLEKGFADLQQAGPALRAKAQALLQQL